MATIEVSAIYKADQDGFHLDDQAKAIFEAHGGEWVDQNTCYGGPMHLDRTITCQMPVIELLNQEPTESSWETVNKVLPPILDAAAAGSTRDLSEALGATLRPSILDRDSTVLDSAPSE